MRLLPTRHSAKKRAAASAASASPAAPDRRRSIAAMPVNLHAPALARAHVTRALQAAAVGDDALQVVRLLVSELVTNVVRHETSRLVEVDVAVDVDHAVTVTVSGGDGLASVAFVNPPDLPDPMSEGGRGLEMLDTLTSAWGTRRAYRATSVWFSVPPGAALVPKTDDQEASAQTAASKVLAEATAITAATEAELTAAPALVAGRAAVTAEHAAQGAAARAAEAAKSARTTRAFAATVAAEAVADTAARTVDAVQHHADEQAQEVATAATLAAATVAGSIRPGGDAAAARAALQVQATVQSAAAAQSEQTAHAAVVVARAVAEAAAGVAAAAAEAAAAVEHEVSDAAVAVQAVTDATAQQLADDTFERGAALALVASDEAAATERWQRANQVLLKAGRRDRAVALALQAAMLTHLPESNELELAARYLTAAEQDQVGGDWYDALVLPNGSTTLVIGDVVGHDITAASVMGQLRNLLRALLWDRDEPPSAIVTRLDRAIRDLQIDTMASAVVLSVERPTSPEPAGSVMLRWTNAGHPAPLVIHADGTAVTLDDTTDIQLGVLPDTVRRDHSHVVPPGATLLLYTDGLVETRHESIDAGQRRLLAAVRDHHRLEPNALLDAVLADMVGDHPRDDVAVLAVRFPPTPLPKDSWPNFYRSAVKGA